MGTGEWHDVEELYVDVRVVTELDDLDLIANFDWGDGDLASAMQPLSDMAKSIKTVIENGARQGAYEISDTTRSFQELAIARNGNIASGALISNITTRKIDEWEYLIGPNVAHFYPLCIEFGRGDVYPINFKYLHYYTLSGVEVFSKHSNPSRPYPFVKPSFEETIRNAEEIMRRCIDNANY